MNRLLKIFLLTLLVIFTLSFVLSRILRVTPLSWGHDEVNMSFWSNEAINGYDPVAYFTVGKAVPGSDSFSVEWNEAKWLFSSDENRSLFESAPDQYAPQYGGYCGYAVAKGFTANTDPEVFEILNGKLYLFVGENEKEEWMKNWRENIRKCEDNWY
ncbi:YHS domain-containing (seleno)protein [Reichenbachiella ulvae]|uniref:YHS domain protein n=1 Tax=Reichenbachiella ulvae TaxID=2980104 RepID=A0ABT3CPX7_9BACT|nr:YHS domain-containing (seleno)protein [Reichenbachiella ulvae]MCV9385773.1 YHS domain protein [Reichenbachiella ulvae]